MKYLFILFFTFSLKFSYCAQVIGADIYYKILNNKTIEVFVKRYTWLNEKDTQAIKIYYKIGNLIDNKVSVKISSKLNYNGCDTTKAYKDYSGKISVETIFKATFDFDTKYFDSLIDKHCKITFYYDSDKRERYFSNIQSSYNLFLDAEINFCQLKSNKIEPNFSNNPIFTMCCNQTFRYNIGYINQKDIVDSFAFELADALDSINKKVKYYSPFSGKIPITPYCPPNPGTINCKPQPNALPARGLYFDQNNGDLIFTPTNCDEVGVIVFKQKLYKLDSFNNYIELGYIKREMTMINRQCIANNSPLIISSSNSYNVCEGSKICFNIKITDDLYLPNQNKKDTVEIILNSDLNNHNLTYLDTNISIKDATFCWQTKLGDGKIAPYHLSIIGKEKNCPKKGLSSKGFLIYVKPNTIKYKVKLKPVECNKVEVLLDKANFKNINWQIFSRYNVLVDSKNRFTDTAQLKFPYDSFYYIKSIVDNDNICFNIDTFKNIKFDSEYINYYDTNTCQSANNLNLNLYNLQKNNNAIWFDANHKQLTNKIIPLNGSTFPITLNYYYKLSTSNNCLITNYFNFTIHDTFRNVLLNRDFCFNSIYLNLFENGFYKRKKYDWISSKGAIVDGYDKLYIYNSSFSNFKVRNYYDSNYCRNYDEINYKADKPFLPSFTSNVTKGYAPLLVTFTNTILGNNLSYLWKFEVKNKIFTTTFKNTAQYYDSAGKYNVSLYISGKACKDSVIKKQYIEVLSPINNIQKNDLNPFIIYPNPTTDKIYIKTDKQYTAQIIDISGRIVINLENNQEFKLTKGIYLIKIKIDDIVYTEKIVVL